MRPFAFILHFCAPSVPQEKQLESVHSVHLRTMPPGSCLLSHMIIIAVLTRQEVPSMCLRATVCSSWPH